MSIIDILLLALIGVAVGFAVRHILKNKSTCGCSGSCKDCACGCGKKCE